MSDSEAIGAIAIQYVLTVRRAEKMAAALRECERLMRQSLLNGDTVEGQARRLQELAYVARWLEAPCKRLRGESQPETEAKKKPAGKK